MEIVSNITKQASKDSVMIFMILVLLMCMFLQDVLVVLKCFYANFRRKQMFFSIKYQPAVRILLKMFCVFTITCPVVIMVPCMFHYLYVLMCVDTCQKHYVLIFGHLLLDFLTQVALILNTGMMKE